MKKTLLALSTLIFICCIPRVQKINVYSIGDSTMADMPTANNYPGRGWMQMIEPFFKENVSVHNYGKSGRSSKSYREEGFWKQVIGKVQAGDYVFIQFGHNDEKPDSARHTDPATGFRENIVRYVQETQAKGAYPILFTSIARRSFDAGGHLKDTHGDYVTVVRKLAAELKVPLVDLNEKTTKMVESLGAEASKKLYMYVAQGVTPSLPEGKKDDTHLCEYGATRVAALAAEGIKELHLPLSDDVVSNTNK